MRIAVCFSGQIRTGAVVAPNILRYIGDLRSHCDIFVHTWDVQSHPSSANYGFSSTDHQVISDFYSIYRPLSIVVEPYALRAVDKDWSGFRVEPQTGRKIIAMFESIFEAHLLKSLHEQKHGFVYDHVVRIRPDTVFHPEKRLVDDINLITDPNMFVYGAHKGDFGMSRLEDIFWIGPSAVIDKIVEYYDYRADHDDGSDWQFQMAAWIRQQDINFRALADNRMRIYYQNDVDRGIDPMDPNFGNPPGAAGSPY